MTDQQVPEARKWGHAAEWVALLGVFAFAAVAVLVRAGHGLPGWTLWTVELAGGLIALVTAWAATGHAWFAWACGLTGFFLGAWTIFAEHTRVWNPVTILTFLAGGAVLIPLASVTYMRLPRDGGPKAIPPKPDADEAKRKKIQQYEFMFAQIGQEGIKVTDVRENRSGLVAELELPNSGRVTRATLEAAAPAIEAILRAMPGAVRFEFGAHSGHVIMRVREKDVLSLATPLGPQHRATTVNQPFAVGLQEDGSPLKITLRQLHMMLVGATGMGKSNLMNVIIAQLASCPDAIIWVIDLKGGRMARAWIQAWAEKKTDAPALDWVATNREEAARMVNCFLTAIEIRMNSGKGGSRITPSTRIPQIILICDEMADILGDDGPRVADAPVLNEMALTNPWFISKVARIGQKGRSEAASGIWASQRGTSDMGGAGKLKANWRLRVALGTATEGELNWIIPDAGKITKQLSIMGTQPGIGVFATGRRTSQLTKIFFHDHPENAETGEVLCDEGCIPECPVYKTSIEVGLGERRPKLDEMTAGPLGDDYALRWNRSRHLVGARAGDIRPVPGGQVDTSGFEDVMVGGGFPDPEEKNPVKRKTLEILAAKGAFGASPQVLLNELADAGMGTPGQPSGVERETLQRWLAEWESRGMVHNPDTGRWRFGPGKSRDRKAA